MLTHQGWSICLYIQPLLASQTTEFVICISIYIKLHAFTLLPPPRSLVPRLGLGTTWVRQLQSGSCPYPTAGPKRSGTKFYEGRNVTGMKRSGMKWPWTEMPRSRNIPGLTHPTIRPGTKMFQSQNVAPVN